MCISFFIIYITQILNFYIYIKNMKENNEDNNGKKIDNENNILNENGKNILNKNEKNIK